MVYVTENDSLLNHLSGIASDATYVWNRCKFLYSLSYIEPLVRVVPNLTTAEDFKQTPIKPLLRTGPPRPALRPLLDSGGAFSLDHDPSLRLGA